MYHLRLHRVGLLLAAAFLGLVIGAPSPAPAMESTPPSAGPATGQSQQSAPVKRKKTKSTSGQKQQRSDR